METVREKIIQEITFNLSSIAISGGYNTDIGQNIFRADMLAESDILPAVFVTTGKEAATRKHRKDVLLLDLTLTAMSFYPATTDRKTEMLGINQLAEKMLGDLRKAMGLQVVFASDVLYISGGYELMPDPNRGETAAVVVAEYGIKYQTNANDPYN